VSDAFVRAAAVAGQERGAVYNVGSGRQTTLAEVVDVVRRLMRVDAEPVWGSMPGRAWDTTVWVADNARIRAALGWEPRHDLEDGLGRMVAWLAHVPGIVRRYRHTPAPGAAARAARRAAR
jgi:nucleoside-diphosphate-sugar epimerase